MIGAVKKKKIKELCANKQISRGLTNHSPPPQKRGGGSEGNDNKNQEHKILVLSLWEKVDKGATEINWTLW